MSGFVLVEWPLAIAMVAGGLYLLMRSDRGSAEMPVRVPWIGKLSAPTGATIAIVLLIVGYHTASTVGPERFFPLRVPPRLGWLVYAGGVLAVVGALLADRLDREA